MMEQLAEGAMQSLLLVEHGGQQLLVPSSGIREVVKPVALTPVPMGPVHVRGLSNIHGQIVCIIDAGVITSLPACDAQPGPRTRFLLLRHPSMHVGLWVDAVCSIRQVDTALLQEAAGDGLLGELSIDGETLPLLLCERLLQRVGQQDTEK